MPVDEEMGRMMCEMKILNDDWWVELNQIGAQRPRQKVHLIITSGIEDRTLGVKVFISYTKTRMIIPCNYQNSVQSYKFGYLPSSCPLRSSERARLGSVRSRRRPKILPASNERWLGRYFGFVRQNLQRPDFR